MKHLIVVYLLLVFAAGINVQAFAQEDQADGFGVRLQGLRGGTMYPHSTNSATLKKNRRIESARTLSGVRRLVPQEYLTIQAAIDASADGDTVLVSDGTYVENIRFRCKAIVVASLYLVDDDTSHIEQTIIDGSNPSHPDSASVVYFIDGEDTTSVLCGFTITGGAGTLWTTPWRGGGGVYCVGASGAKIIDNRITKNYVSGQSATAAGVFFLQDNGFLILERNRISDNHVSANPGTGLGCAVGTGIEGVTVRIVENIFERDTVVAQDYADGGALYIQGGDTPIGGVIRGNVFRGNIADATNGNGLGGGAFIWATSEMEIQDNHFEDNIAKSTNAWAEGGALLIDDEPPASGYGRKMVAGNRFISNLSSSQFGNGTGGGLELFRTLATVSGNYFEQNTAQGGASRGGATRIASSAFRLENNVLAENTALAGGGVYASNPPQSGDDLEIINNTIVNNTASSGGGGINVATALEVRIINSILWGNVPTQLTLTTTGEVRYSDVQGGWLGDGNIDVNPFFADTVDYQLSDSSLCIGAGIDSIEIGGIWYYAPPTDIGGNPRPNPAGSMPDIGAWESPFGNPGTVIHVPANYPTIQAAIDAATDGNTVLVEDGTYLENINFKGKAITVASHYIIDGDTNHIANTIIDGSQPSNPDSGSVVYFISGEDTNSVLSGFTITGGSGTYGNNFMVGGGILCLSGATICHNKIINNSLSNTGGVAFGGGISAGSPFMMDHVHIKQNTIGENFVEGTNVWGGGIWFGTNGCILGNIVGENVLSALSGTTSGGGIGAQAMSSGGTHVMIKDNVIRGNTSKSLSSATGCYGGGLDIYYPTVELIGNTIESNTTSSIPYTHAPGFRVIYTGEGSVVDGNVVKYNREIGTAPTVSGGGIALYEASPMVTNNIVAGNGATLGSGVRIIALTAGGYPEAPQEETASLALIADEAQKDSHSSRQSMHANKRTLVPAPIIINNTIVDNAGGAGIRSSDANLKIFNTILWGNAGGSIEWISGTIDVRYSDVAGGWSGDGNINAEPFFTDPIDYQLSDSSLCIGAGIDSIEIGGTWYYAPPIDMGGNPRPTPSGCEPDIGAWESVLCGPATGLPSEITGKIPSTYSLHQSYPNPFNPSTTIAYQVPKQSNVRIEIYNMLGQKVRTLLNDRKEPGEYTAVWDGRNDSGAQVGSGIYLYRMIAGDFVQIRKMILMK